MFTQSLEDKNYYLYPAERYFPYSGCVVQVGSQCVSGAEWPCQKSSAGLLHVTLLLERPGTVQVVLTMMLCVFWAAMSPAGSSGALW